MTHPLRSRLAAVLLGASLALVPACDDGTPGAADPSTHPKAAAAAPPAEAPLTAADQALMQQAARSVQEDRLQETDLLLAPLLARTPPPADAQFIAGSAAYERGDYAQAVTRLMDAIARKPSYLPNSSALGFAQFKLGDFGGARSSFERIVESNDAAFKAHYGLGLVALSEGRLADARRHLERALALSPGYLKARFQMARLLQEEGRLAESAVALEAVLAEWPTHEEALYRLAQVSQALGREEQAAALVARHALVYKARETIGALTQRIRSGDDLPSLHAEIARLWLSAGDTEEAARALAAGLRRFPNDSTLREMLQSLRQSDADQPAPAPEPSPPTPDGESGAAPR